MSTAQALKTRVESSLNKAITAGELSPPDQMLVRSMWENLYQVALPLT